MASTSPQKNKQTTWYIAVIALLALGCCVLLLIVGVLLYPQIASRLRQVAPNTPSGASPSPVLMQTLQALTQTPKQPSPPTEIPPGTQPPAATTEPPPPTVSYQGVSFSFEPALASGATSETVPAATPVSEDAPPGEAFPQHFQFKFNGYPLSGTFHEPQILIYPIQDYAAMVSPAGDIFSKLKTTLSEKPAQAENLPFLPMWNAAQVFVSNIKYLDFKNGSGVRYLTQFAQSFSPINNKDAFYTFQGYTGDGKYYIAAILPISNPMLVPDDQTIPGGDFEAFSKTFTTYLSDVKQKLAAQPDDSFTPKLGQLDAMMQSLSITP